MISKNEYTQIVQDFCSFSRRKKVRIAGYVILFTTQTMGKKTSKLGIFFAGNRLMLCASNNRAGNHNQKNVQKLASFIAPQK